MATTAAEHLALINAVITERMGAGAVEEYREAYNQFRGTPLKELYEIRDRLTAETGATSGSFRLAEPFDV
jgi:hypothetical protein